jgi:hypothetical protein
MEYLDIKVFSQTDHRANEKYERRHSSHACT